METEPEASGDGAGPGSAAVPWLRKGQIVVSNGLPVIGVWFLGWEPLTPIFFYWLDSLLAFWGLGVVALVVTSREEPRNFGASGARLVWLWIAITSLMLAILAVPSVVAAMAVFGTLGLDLGEILRRTFASTGAASALVVAVAIQVWQVIGELRWRPDLSLKATGVERGNALFLRILAMAMLAFWGGHGAPTRLALAIYVLLVAGLFSFSQLQPDRYLRAIGLRRGGEAAAAGARRRRS